MAAPTTGDVKGNFKLLQDFALPYAPEMKVQKWKSLKTGLTLVWANFQSPLLNAYLTVPTEIFNDSGVPHTLEHLIFLGSHKYPYKGLLDSLANRAFANGTNAWTATDHTAYELTTASSDGFLRMLPIYTDHLFSATMTDAGFVTEVYHINGKGQDAGVVFSEMQGRENTSGDLLAGRIQKSLYRDGSAYRSDTGGLMGKLRVLTVDEIRDYHAKYYAPHNVALVVAGPLPADELLKTANAIDDDLIKSGKAPGPSGPSGWTRPFLTTPSASAPVIDGTEAGDDPSLFPVDDDSSRDKLRRKNTIEFPEEDESTGEVYLTWMGTTWGQWLEEEAISVLETYLTDSAVSPLQRALVERDDPLCTDISFSSETQAGRGTLSAYFSSVPTEKLADLDLELIRLLKKIVEEGVDMERMKMCIKRDRIKELNQLEVRTAECFADSLIIDHLYGNEEGADLPTGMDSMARYDQLGHWTSEQWTALLSKYYIDNPRLVVVGRPSKALAKRLKKETKALEASRRSELGEDGLKQRAAKVEEARKINDRPIPDELLNGFKIPSKDSIIWIESGQALVGTRPKTSGQHVPSARTQFDEQLEKHLGQDREGSDSSPLPFPVQFAQVSSAFVRITLVFPTTDLPSHLRPLMELYLETFFSLPIKRNGAELVSYEDVIKGLDNDTVDYDTRLGVGTGFAENVSITIKVEKEKYAQAVEWLRDLVWNSVFAVERLKISAAKTTQTLPELKRDGSSLSWALSRLQTHDLDKSTNVATSILSILTHMPLLNKALTETPEKVVEQLEEIRTTVFRPDNLVVGVTGNVCGVSEPFSTWSKFTSAGHGTTGASEALRVPWTREVLTPLALNPSKKGLICPLPTIESSYSVFTGRGILGYNQPDSAALTVALAIMNATEGPFWRCIRGAGLAYGAGIRASPEAGLLQFTLYRSPDSGKAFIEARKVVKALLDDSPSSDSSEPGLTLDQPSLDAAKSLLHYSAAESESNPSQTAGGVFVDEVIKGVGRGNARRALDDIAAVGLADVRRVLVEYVLPLFDPQTSICAIASSPGRVGEIEKALKEIGYEMETREIDLGSDEGDDDEDMGSASGSESSASESEEGSSSEEESSGVEVEERK